MIKSCLHVYEVYLKRLHDLYQPKKSKTLETDDINNRLITNLFRNEGAVEKVITNVISQKLNVILEGS